MRAPFRAAVLLPALKPTTAAAATATAAKAAGPRAFSTTRRHAAKNQIYDAVRRPGDFHTYLLLSASARTPLVTLWTASWCASCRTVAPRVREMVAAGVGEAEGGLAYCEVEYDAPDVMGGGLGLDYMITSIPTLLSFDAQEAQTRTKVADARQLADPRFLEEWLRNEARRHGGRGGGGGGSLLGGLFKSWRD